MTLNVFLGLCIILLHFFIITQIKTLKYLSPCMYKYLQTSGIHVLAEQLTTKLQTAGDQLIEGQFTATDFS